MFGGRIVAYAFLFLAFYGMVPLGESGVKRIQDKHQPPCINIATLSDDDGAEFTYTLHKSGQFLKY